jgi:hypothetical protein
MAVGTLLGSCTTFFFPKIWEVYESRYIDPKTELFQTLQSAINWCRDRADKLVGLHVALGSEPLPYVYKREIYISKLDPKDREWAIGELLSKASEYVETYKQTFAAAKGSLETASQPGFYDRAATMCAQASQVIAAIKKNGSTAVALVSLIAVLDDMSLNGARASSSTLLLAVEDKPAMQDF